MSSQIDAERKDYYRQLKLAQRGEIDITAWLTWFVGCLSRAIESSDVRLAGVLNKARISQQLQARPVNERQRIVINRMLDWERFLSTSKNAKLAKCSSDTALRDIRELLERGVLVQNPGTLGLICFHPLKFFAALHLVRQGQISFRILFRKCGEAVFPNVSPLGKRACSSARQIDLSVDYPIEQFDLIPT